MALAEFRKTNQWFGKADKNGNPNPNYDIHKTAVAKELEDDMIGSFKGSYSELLREISGKVDEMFTDNRPKLAAVGGVDNMYQPKKKGLELTPDQKRTAHMMFPDESDPEKIYLDELKKNKGAA
jgi:hypothetical protein